MDYSDDSNGFDNFSLETIDTAHSQRVGSSHVIDLRTNPRINTRFRAWMISAHGKVDGLVTNLSSGGLRFEAGSELPDLFKKGKAEHAGHSREIVEIYFDVPAQDSADRNIIVQARTAYVIGDDEGNYSCGVEFKVFAEGEQALEDYLHSRGVAK